MKVEPDKIYLVQCGASFWSGYFTGREWRHSMGDYKTPTPTHVHISGNYFEPLDQGQREPKQGQLF